jgi:ketosteroid isomerase-like protein
MRRFEVALLAAAAALAGYGIGNLRVTVAEAARSDAAEALKEADRQFDAATAREGIEGWVSYFAEDGIMMPGGHDLIVGKTAIREYESKAFALPGFALRWEPIDAGVSGDLGYTYGVYKTAKNGPDGQQVFSYGKYATIWRKQRDRSWKIALDIGNSSPAPAKQ